MELAIDTSTRYASIALSEKGDFIGHETWLSQQNHTVELAPAVDRLLKSAGIKPKDLSAVFIALGPGGFSALRVGLSFAKGLAEGLHVPIVGICTLDMEANGYLTMGLPVYSMIDAGRGKIAWAGYTGPNPWRCIAQPQVTTPEELAAIAERPAVFCGEGLPQALAVLRAKLTNAIFSADTPPTRDASVLATLAYRRLERGDHDDPATLQPLYLRQPTITQPKTPKA